MRQVITSCTQDCPDTCSIVAEVSGGRVIKIRGNPDCEITRGFLCRKSRNFLPRLHSKERVLKPRLRDGASWREISWERALDIVAAKLEASLKRYGPLSIYYFRDAGSIAALKMVNERFFNLLGGGTFASGTLCGGAGIAGQTRDFGLRTSHDPHDLLNAKAILVWGRNPAWTNVHLVPILREARKGGCYCVLIDPLPTATSKLVDWHLAPSPGSDAYLAIGLMKVILDEDLADTDFVEKHTHNFDALKKELEAFDLKVISDETGLSLREINKLARIYAESKPAAIVGGWGFQRRRNGAQVYRLLDALAALCGNVGVPGGGVSHGMDETRWFESRKVLLRVGTARREIPKPQTWKGIMTCGDPPIEVAFITAANPVCQCPNSNLAPRAIAGIDFVIVAEMFMTDTAMLADLVLPTTHFLQETDLVGSYWHNYVMPVNVAQARLGEEKTDLEIFALLAKRMGLEKEFPNDAMFFLEILAEPLKQYGFKLSQLMEGPVRPPTHEVPFSDKRFPTPSGRIELISEIVIPSTKRSSAYPYYLLSPHPASQTHSQARSIPSKGYPQAEVSPRVAQTLGVDRGSLIKVKTPQGELICHVEVVPALRDDVVVIHEGTWEMMGGSVNRLTSDELSDEGLCATYNDLACSLSKVEPSAKSVRGSR